jgi:DNA-binding MarR family transcriptional regulator
VSNTIPTLDDERLTLVGLFFESHHGLEREIGRRLAEETGLSPQWFEVLLRLARSPEQRLRMSDLAAQVTLTASGLTRVVDRLEDAGYVRRESCPTDRRGSFAALTDEGLAMVQLAIPSHVEQIDAIFGSVLDQQERSELERLLRLVRDALYPEGTTGIPGCPPGA